MQATLDGQLIAPFTIVGSCNRSVFETWLLTCLIPVLQPGEWVIVDNATFHHGGLIAQLIEAAGCKVIYLPPYSPDLNRIEKCWATLKSRIRKQLRNSDNLRFGDGYRSQTSCVLISVATAINGFC